MQRKQWVEIIECAKLGQRDAVSELIKGGADVNEKNADEDTALLVATRRNDLKMTAILLEAMSQIDVTDMSGYSPIMWAKEHKNLDMSQMIERQSEHKLSAPRSKGSSSLSTSVNARRTPSKR
jgi:ankyrin repeat protein